MKVSSVVAAIVAMVLASISMNGRQTAAPSSKIRVLASNGVKGAIEGLRDESEKTIGRAVGFEFSTAASLSEHIKAGEAFDVAILTSQTVDDLIKAGKIAADTRADVGHTGIGVGIRAGLPKPDISTPEALKQTLLKAKSITLNQNGASATYVMKMFARLGITEAVKPKLMYEQDSGRPQLNVAEGKAEIVLTLIPEIPVYKGVQLVGPLPADLQSSISFAAGVSTNSHDKENAKALIKFLTGPKAASVLKAGGVEPAKH